MRLALLCLLTCSAQSADLREVVVDQEQGRYSLTSTVWFDANIAALYTVFLDYDLAKEFSSFIVESRNLDPDENGRPRFYIRNHGCVWFFCQSFERSGYVEHEPHEFIRSTVDAEVSDFHSSFEYWTFEAEGEGTLVVYQFEFEPKFWIPPLIGPYVLQRKLERDSVRALDRIEALARERTHE